VSSGINGALILDILAGIGILLIGLGIFIACSALARLLARVNGTLDEVARQIGAVSAPVVETLGHVNGMADTADAAIARLGAVVGVLETIAGTTGRVSQLASDAVTPAVVNVGATLTGITAALRRLVLGGQDGAVDEVSHG